MELFEPAAMLALGLFLARTSALVIACPLFGGQASFEGYRLALITTLTAVFWSTSGVPLEPGVGAPEYVLLVLRELGVGLFLGFVTQMILVVLRVSGELVGHEMGLAMAGQVDPITGTNTPVVSRFYEIFFFLGLLAVDGHHLILRSLAQSFDRAPVARLHFDLPVVEFARSLFVQTFAAGLGFAAPVMIVLLLVSILTGLLSRAVPQLNVLEISFSLRVSLALVAMFVFAPLLAPAMQHLYASLATALDEAVGVLES